MERLCSASGPTKGEILIQGKKPKEIVFIHCVGSRDKTVGNEYCSRVCCMYTAKQAHLVRDKIPGAHIPVLYMVVRAFGKGFEEFYERVQKEKIIYRRGNPSEVFRKNGKLVVRGEDTLLGEPFEMEADLVVLASGLVPRKEDDILENMLGLENSSDKFYAEAPGLDPILTKVEGIFLGGCCQGPKDIPDTVAKASAAAAEAISLATRGEIEVEPTTSWIDPELCSGCKLCIEICPYSAIDFHDTKGISVVNEALCKGCGACTAICPSKAAKQNHFTQDQVLAEVEGLVT